MAVTLPENKDLPAFACVAYDNNGSGYQQDGLTKREYFAAMAMQGILTETADRGLAYTAKRAIEFADALLHELSLNK
tara:strand:+ start:897 stop:1127 length:231 start_codon:yes stop_codon:yes gene_type:complete